MNERANSNQKLSLTWLQLALTIMVFLVTLAASFGAMTAQTTRVRADIVELRQDYKRQVESNNAVLTQLQVTVAEGRTERASLSKNIDQMQVALNEIQQQLRTAER